MEQRLCCEIDKRLVYHVILKMFQSGMDGLEQINIQFACQFRVNCASLNCRDNHLDTAGIIVAAFET